MRTPADLGGLSRRGAMAHALREALPAIGGYAAVRAIGLAALAIEGSRTGRSLLDLLTGWDAGWYIGIADHGYDTSVSYRDDGTLVNTNIAFFPLFAWLIRAVSLLGIPSDVAAVLVANLAGLAAAWGIFAVGRRLADARAGIILAVLWGALPHAIVLDMGYTESLFTALCAWALWAVLERRLLLAGVLTALAGLTRPTAVALIVAVGAACILAVRREGGWRPWAGLVLAPAGLVGYIVWCGIAVGRADAYFWMQSQGWEQRFDFGWTTLHELGVTAIHRSPLGMYATGLVLVATAGLFVLLVRATASRAGGLSDNRARLGETLPVLLFTGVLLAIVAVQGGNYWYAKARFLLPAFPVLLPLATRLATARVWVRATTIGVLVAVSAAYGAYLLVTWPLSP